MGYTVHSCAIKWTFLLFEKFEKFEKFENRQNH